MVKECCGQGISLRRYTEKDFFMAWRIEVGVNCSGALNYATNFYQHFKDIYWLAVGVQPVSLLFCETSSRETPGFLTEGQVV